MTTQNKAFEKWAKDHEYAIDDYVYALEIWQAATTEANKRITELESEVDKLKEKLKHSEYAANAEAQFADKLSDQVTELQASNQTLREALEKIKVINDKYIKNGHIDHIVDNAIYSTPAESLQAFENEVLERAAIIKVDYVVDKTSDPVRNKINKYINEAVQTAISQYKQAIRALKEVK